MNDTLIYDLHFEYYCRPDNTFYYKNKYEFTYTSPRYGKQVIVPAGYISDGASGPAPDLASRGWWVHDVLCQYRKWSDGTPCSAWQASMVLKDIMAQEGRPYRAAAWAVATWAWQKARGHN